MNKLICALTVLTVSTAQADTIYVDANCPGGDGSELDPYCSIQTAIDAAMDTDAIVVAPGTYFETINFLGKAITLRSSDGPEVTTIDAGGCFGGRVVTCAGGEGPDTVLARFTVTGGCDYVGGGMYNDGSSPTVIGCVFSNNVADAGGGMYNDGGHPTVTDCIFEGNGTGFIGGGGFGGGGMVNFNSNPTVIGCTFRGNIAIFHSVVGGGMFNFNSNPIIMNCLFDGNVGIKGSGMYNSVSSPTITNCTFTGHPFVDVIHNSSRSKAVLTNCVLWANPFSDQIVDDSSSSSTVRYSDVQGGWFGAGSNNIDADPLFASTNNCCVVHLGPSCDDLDCAAAVCDVEPLCCDEAYDLWNIFCASLALDMCSVCPNDNRFRPGSPCIDAGNNNAIADLTDTDLDGNPRFADDPDSEDTGCGVPVAVDMGPYEYQGNPATVVFADLNADGFVGIADFMILNGCIGSSDPDCCLADLDLDGEVGMSDRLLAWASIAVEFSPVR